MKIDPQGSSYMHTSSSPPISTPLQQAGQCSKSAASCCCLPGLSLERIRPRRTESSCGSYIWEATPVPGASGTEKEGTQRPSHRDNKPAQFSREKVRWKRVKDLDNIFLASTWSSSIEIVAEVKDFSSKSITKHREKLSSSTKVAKLFCRCWKKSINHHPLLSFFAPEKNSKHNGRVCCLEYVWKALKDKAKNWKVFLWTNTVIPQRKQYPYSHQLQHLYFQ